MRGVAVLAATCLTACAGARLPRVPGDPPPQVQNAQDEREYQELLREQEQRHAHELATAELQRKERERYMAQNYEDQLERTQRANARLVQAKS